MNELIYCIDVARKYGQLLGTTVADSLAVRLRDELDARLKIDSIGESHYVSNEEADENFNILDWVNAYMASPLSREIINTPPIQKYEPKGVTQSILDYVEFMGEATYTEMQNYYRSKFGSNSFSHILISLVVPYKNRPTRRYLYKTASGKYVVRVAGLHNWVVNEY